ncbi:MAG: hypothetical protein GXP63_04030 [DPANN group archaeon]|nr:hypothetical protein [DPANN group archaeon]
MKDHLVIAVGGGPLAALYGTPSLKPEDFLQKIKDTYQESGASTMELICVDPHTDAPYTKDLDPHEKGFREPTYQGEGWNGLLVEDGPGKNLASFHEYCGSDSTNLNQGTWRKITDRADKAMEALEQGLEMHFEKNFYHKHEKTGPVPDDLQKKVLTPYR